VERFGIVQQGSPRHSDILVATGPITAQIRDRAKRIYEQIPEPKYVIAVGGCACSGGVFRNCYNVMGGIDDLIPVTAYIPGCPPRPEAIIDCIAKILEQLKDGG
jgi:Ni,Fe-hydrogenase III small subunit